MQMIELKPCPFCGGKARLIAHHGGGIFVFCSKCRARTDLHCDAMEYETHAVANAIKAWNRRCGDGT